VTEVGQQDVEIAYKHPWFLSKKTMFIKSFSTRKGLCYEKKFDNELQTTNGLCEQVAHED